MLLFFFNRTNISIYRSIIWTIITETVRSDSWLIYIVPMHTTDYRKDVSAIVIILFESII